MSNAHKLEIGGMIAVFLFGAVHVSAKQPKQADFEAPVPAQILSARSIFIPNEGKGCGPFVRGGFPGGRNRTYNEFYAAMKKWGHYKLAETPADADLDFAISFSCPSVGATVTSGDSVGWSVDPEFRLVILDVKTRMVLWGFTERIQAPKISLFSHGKEEIERNSEAAMARLVNDVKALATGTEVNSGGQRSQSGPALDERREGARGRYTI